MAANDKIEQLKSHVERLRRDSVDVGSNARRIVFEGVQKLAEQELKALNDYYKSAVSSAKSKKGDKPYQDLASEQIDLLQSTVQTVIGHARDSLSIIADTRAELSRLTAESDAPLSQSAVSRITGPAQKAIKEMKEAATKAQKAAAKTAKDVQKTLNKEIAAAEKKGKSVLKQGEKDAKKVVKKARKRLDTVLDVKPPRIVNKTVTTRPSSTSRAARVARAAGKTRPAPTAAKNSTSAKNKK